MVTAAYSESFQSVHDFLFDVTSNHPNSIYLELLAPHRFVQIDKNPDEDLRIQFSYGSEGGQEATILRVREGVPAHDSKLTLGRISITGEISIRPLRGWHVFDLIPDGTIDNFESPSKIGVPTSESKLSDPEVDELAAWLDENHDRIWSD